MDLYGLLYNPFGFALPFLVIGAVISGLRAKRRGETRFGIFVSATIGGFLTMVIAAVVMFVAVMVLWGMSI